MENIENWKQAGRIAAQALAYGKELIKPGASLLEVSDKTEAMILESGGQMAFPVQLSCNHIAAHYCADTDDNIILNDQVVCLDIGVHIKGCIGDNACTVDLSKQNTELVQASEDALRAAIRVVRPGVTMGEIGKVIQETITGYGFAPIRNLTGHGLSPYNIHDGPSIPNFACNDNTELQDGEVIAIEPFASTGAGVVYEMDNANIFALTNKKPVRNIITRQVMDEIDNYNGLPFTTRWLARKFPLMKVNLALKELLSRDIITQYPPLPDRNKGLVSQAEHTLLIGDKVEVLTKSRG